MRLSEATRERREDIKAAAENAPAFAGGLDAAAFAALPSTDRRTRRALKNALSEIGEAVTLMTAATETTTHIVGFTGGMVPLPLSPSIAPPETSSRHRRTTCAARPGEAAGGRSWPA